MRPADCVKGRYDVKIPRTVDDVTPEWLTEALRGSETIQGAAIRSFDATQLQGGAVGTVNRLNLKYTSSDLSVPDSVILKLPSADEAWREFINRTGAYERETRFYAELVSSLNAQTPIVYHAEMDLDAGAHVLLLEDLQHLSDGDQLLGLGEQETWAAIRYLAALHSSWWNDRRLDSMPWLMRPGEATAYGRMDANYAKGLESGLERLSNWLPSGIEDIARRFARAVPSLFQDVDGSPVTLTHGDFKIGNLFFSDADKIVEVTAIDWQVVGAYRGASDVAYFMCWSLNTEERRRNENRLLDEYHAALLTGGVTDYPYGDFILDYRRGFFRNLLILIAANDNMSDEIFESNSTPGLHILCNRMQTLIDWDCGELIPD
jgi:thiamine kinase-like enzyme